MTKIIIVEVAINGIIITINGNTTPMSSGQEKYVYTDAEAITKLTELIAEERE